MRSSSYLLILLAAIMLLDMIVYGEYLEKRKKYLQRTPMMREMVGQFGLSDLSISTEARYTRHPSVSDPVVPFMDHPGNIEHFPSGSFWYPASIQ